MLVKYDELESEMYDIVSEWKEPIDEEKLDELACSNADLIEIGRPITINHVVRAYKAGYRKALENKL